MNKTFVSIVSVLAITTVSVLCVASYQMGKGISSEEQSSSSAVQAAPAPISPPKENQTENKQQLPPNLSWLNEEGGTGDEHYTDDPVAPPEKTVSSEDQEMKDLMKENLRLQNEALKKEEIERERKRISDKAKHDREIFQRGHSSR